MHREDDDDDDDGDDFEDDTNEWTMEPSRASGSRLAGKENRKMIKDWKMDGKENAEPVEKW